MFNVLKIQFAIKLMVNVFVKMDFQDKIVIKKVALIIVMVMEFVIMEYANAINNSQVLTVLNL